MYRGTCIYRPAPSLRQLLIRVDTPETTSVRIYAVDSVRFDIATIILCRPWTASVLRVLTGNILSI